MSAFAKYDIAFALVIPLGIIGNALLIAVIASDKKLHTSATLYHVFIAVSGLFHSVAVVPWLLLVAMDRIPAEVCSKIMGLLFIGFTMKTSLWLAQALDRWIFVFKPLRYHTLVTTKRTILVCLACVVYSLTISVTHGWVGYQSSKKMLQTFEMVKIFSNGLIIFSDSQKCLGMVFSEFEFTVFLFYGNYCSLIFASSVLYFSILIVARKRSKSIGLTNEAGSSQIHSDIRLPAQSRRHRGTVLLLASLFLFAFTWLPILIGLGIDTDGFTDTAGFLRNSDNGYYYATQVVAINTEISLNPWLTAFLQRDFRRATFSLFVRWLPFLGGKLKRDSTSGNRRQKFVPDQAKENISIVNLE